jgi:hypothetical protein
MPRGKGKKSVSAPLAFVPVRKRAGPISAEPIRDYPSVGMQQGRVPLDPDSNEQGAIDGRPPRFEKKITSVRPAKRNGGK